MPEYPTLTWFAVGITLFELFAALLLHSTGLYLLFTARNKRIMVWILAHLSFVELTNVIYDSVNNIHLLITDKLFNREKYHLALLMFFLSAQFLTLITITTERVIAVKLTIKYHAVVNKRRLLFVFVLIWIISTAMSLVVVISTKPVFNILLVVWEVLVVIVTICSYNFIALTVRRRRKRLTSSAPNVPAPRLRLNLTVPFLIVLTMICFYLIPDMLLALGIEFSIWFRAIFCLNYVTDALIYIFGLPQFRNRVKRFFCGNKARSQSAMTNLSTISIADERYKETSI